MIGTRNNIQQHHILQSTCPFLAARKQELWHGKRTHMHISVSHKKKSNMNISSEMVGGTSILTDYRINQLIYVDRPNLYQDI